VVHLPLVRRARRLVRRRLYPQSEYNNSVNLLQEPRLKMKLAYSIRMAMMMISMGMGLIGPVSWP
jgi:hypothetical protein